MHPVNYLFDEIMRHYWGMPQHSSNVRPARIARFPPGGCRASGASTSIAERRAGSRSPRPHLVGALYAG